MGVTKMCYKKVLQKCYIIFEYIFRSEKNAHRKHFLFKYLSQRIVTNTEYILFYKIDYENMFTAWDVFFFFLHRDFTLNSFVVIKVMFYSFRYLWTYLNIILPTFSTIIYP